MLAALKRWLSPKHPEMGQGAVAAWAQSSGYSHKPTHDRLGAVVEGKGASGIPWRMEWGAPQRAYISGQELRLRAALRLPQDLQMLLISRSLMESLERETFDRYTESTQTVIDVATPEEMRWLAMFPKARLTEHEGLRSAYGAVAIRPKWANAWLDGELAELAAAFATQHFTRPTPFVLMTTRGNVYLRMGLDAPGAAELASAVLLFDCAARRARRLADELRAGTDDWPSTNSSAFSPLHGNAAAR